MILEVMKNFLTTVFIKLLYVEVIILALVWSCAESDIITDEEVWNTSKVNILEDDSMNTQDPSHTTFAPFYIGFNEDILSFSESLRTTSASVSLYYPGSDELINTYYISDDIQKVYFRSREDTVYIKITKPGYNTIEGLINLDSLVSWNNDYPKILTLSHRKEVEINRRFAGLYWDYEDENFVFADVGWYGNETIRVRHDLDARAPIFNNNDIDTYNYMGYRFISEWSTKRYLVNVSPISGYKTEFELSDDFLSYGAFAYSKYESGFYCMASKGEGFELVFWNQYGEQELIDSLDQFNALVGFWSELGHSERTFWFGIHDYWSGPPVNQPHNHIAGYDLDQDSVVFMLKVEKLRINSLRFHNERGLFYGIGTNDDGSFYIGTLDFYGNEEIVAIDIVASSMNASTILDEENDHFYVFVLAGHHEGNPIYETVIVDLSDLMPIHSFTLKNVVPTTLSIKSNYLFK